MAGHSEHEKLDALAARIQAEAAPKTPAAGDNSAAAMKVSRVGFDFVSAVLGCAFVGWLVDRGLGSGPWGLLAMVIIGFGIGIMNIWRALGSQSQG